MANPYEILARSAQETSSAFEQVNRNAIASFNAQAEAAKFGFQSNLQTAQFQHNQVMDERRMDMQTQRLNLAQRTAENRMKLDKLRFAREISMQERQFDVDLAREARQNLEAQLEQESENEQRLEMQSVFGDLDADRKLKRVRDRKQGIRKSMDGVYSRLRSEMERGNIDGMMREVNEIDYELGLREREEVEIPDGIRLPRGETSGTGRDPSDLSVAPSSRASGGLLPRLNGDERQEQPRESVIPSENRAALGTEPLAVSQDQQRNAEAQQRAGHIFPAALNSLAQKGKQAFSNFLSEVGVEGKEFDNTDAEVGAVFEDSPEVAPTSGQVEMRPEQRRKFHEVINMSPDSAPDHIREILPQAKRRAYRSLLASGDPQAKQDLSILKQVATDPNLSSAQADEELEEGVRAGMISDRTARKWKLVRQRNASLMNQRPEDEEDRVTADALDKQLQVLNRVMENKERELDEGIESPISEELISGIASTVEATARSFNEDAKERSIKRKLENMRGDEEAGQLVLQELQSHQYQKRRRALQGPVSEMRNQLRSRNILAEDESAIALLEKGESAFVDTITDRISGTGVNRKEARTEAQAMYQSFNAAAPYVSTEVGEDGAPLKAPTTLGDLETRSAAEGAVTVDNTFTGKIREFFGADEEGEDISLRDRARGTFNRDLASDLGVEESEVQQVGDYFVSGVRGLKSGNARRLERGRFSVEDYLKDWADTPELVTRGVDLIKERASRAADIKTEERFSGGAPSRDEQNALKQSILEFDIPGEYDLSVRRDYHNALKRVNAVRILRSIKGLEDMESRVVDPEREFSE